MKPCQNHWDALRLAIDKRGLSQFVAKSGQEVARKMVDEEADKKANFEPLMGAFMNIVQNAVRIGGMYLLADDFCPICESEKNGGPPADWWIDNAADNELQRAVELGLIKGN